MLRRPLSPSSEGQPIVERDRERTKFLFSHVDLLMCQTFMWLKWKRGLGSVYSTIKLCFKSKDFTTLKLYHSTHKRQANALLESNEILIPSR